MIAQYLENGQNTWDQWLPEITLAINSSVNDTTGFSPDYIILGREPRMPGALYDQVTDVAGNEPPSPEERTRRMEDIFKLVHENQLNATQNQKKYYDLRRRDWRPNIGSMVMLKQHVLSNAIEGFNAKLPPKYKGPYKIIKFLSSNVVRLQETQGVNDVPPVWLT
ncbi:uncharacterized protein [Drosophila tropicalis]|uniref:uncharacterized protein n=1 Tax=Drosophila tropicalis TaxID=46794 RepID=UPI0035ABC786